MASYWDVGALGLRLKLLQHFRKHRVLLLLVQRLEGIIKSADVLGVDLREFKSTKLNQILERSLTHESTNKQTHKQTQVEINKQTNRSYFVYLEVRSSSKQNITNEWSFIPAIRREGGKGGREGGRE